MFVHLLFDLKLFYYIIKPMIPEIKPLPIEEAKARFSKVHGKTQTAPSFPAMLFGGVLNSAKDVKNAEIRLRATPRPRSDPREN